MGLFDNSNSLLGLGGMLLAAGAPSTQSVGSRLGVGFQNLSAQQKQDEMAVLQKRLMEGQIAGQGVTQQAQMAKMQREKQQQQLLASMLGQGGGQPPQPGMMGPRVGNDSATSMPPQQGGGLRKLTLDDVAKGRIAGVDLMPIYKAQNPEAKAYSPILLADPSDPKNTVMLDKTTDQQAIAAKVAQGWREAATPDSASRNIQLVGPYEDENGNYLGQYVLDKGTRQLVKTGTNEPLPPGAVPRTTTQLGREIMDVKDFNKLGDDLYQDELSLRALRRYAGTVKDSRQGLSLMADKVAGTAKTLFGTSPLSKSELATMEGSGQLQGLLGKWREEVVGGGVMTEFDAQRVLDRLGGDVNALRNPQVVQRLLTSLYKDKLDNYKRKAHRYETQRSKYYKSSLPAHKFSDEDYKTMDNIFQTGDSGSGGFSIRRLD